MRFVTVREIRNNPGKVWESLKDGEIVLTQRGKPIALMTGVGEDDFEAKLSALRRAKLHEALERIRKAASDSGADQLGEAEIDEIIAETRRARR